MKLSVSMITYNHEKFIRQAIESVLMQETDFDYELVIGEDNSTDHTYDIISEYQHAYPDKIRVFHSGSNIGSNRNYTRTFFACRGEYIATVDGDDYWTSPLKLQKQVDFFKQHPDCVMCYHDVRSFWEDGSRPSSVLPLKMRQGISTIQDLLAIDHFMPSSSVMFRSGLVKDVPEWFFDIPIGDWPFHVLHAQYGNIGYISEVLGAYRRHEGGLLLQRNYEAFWLGELRMYRGLLCCLDRRYGRAIKDLISNRYYLLADYLERNGNQSGARSYALRRAALRPFDTNNESALKQLIRLYIPHALCKLLASCKKTMLAHSSTTQT